MLFRECLKRLNENKKMEWEQMKEIKSSGVVLGKSSNEYGDNEVTQYHATMTIDYCSNTILQQSTTIMAVIKSKSFLALTFLRIIPSNV